MIIEMNSWPRSTFDCSIAPADHERGARLPGVVTSGPEFGLERYMLFPMSDRPSALLNSAKATWPSDRTSPFENTPVIVPSRPIEKSVSVPAGTPSVVVTCRSLGDCGETRQVARLHREVQAENQRHGARPGQVDPRLDRLRIDRPPEVVERDRADRSPASSDPCRRGSSLRTACVPASPRDTSVAESSMSRAFPSESYAMNAVRTDSPSADCTRDELNGSSEIEPSALSSRIDPPSMSRSLTSPVFPFIEITPVDGSTVTPGTPPSGFVPPVRGSPSWCSGTT